MANEQLLSIETLNALWDNELIPLLCDYIKIPNKSPLFDKNWKQHGYMDQAMQLIAEWVSHQTVKGMQHEVLQLPGRTPLLFIEIEGDCDDTVLLYGHMDKQPEMTGWENGLGPWRPVIKNDKLYGRGGADDGYAIFSALTAIRLLQEQHQKIPHCVIIIEGSEESGSCDLPFYLDHLHNRIGHPRLVITLDSDCGNYDQLWLTTSLRGIVGGTLRIDTQKEGVHSGLGSGVMPSCFSVLREVLDRVEDSHSHDIKIAALHADIPSIRKQQNIDAAKALGADLINAQPLSEGTKPIHCDNSELKLNQTWRPSLSVTGMDGIPNLADAGNVRLPYIEVKLSFRIPPNTDPNVAVKALSEVLEKNPPHGAIINFHVQDIGSGWEAPTEKQWLLDAGHKASHMYYQKPMMLSGGGGSIPFMGLLGKQYPEAQFFITGVLGPKSNAHGPNEFLHIPYVKKLTGCVSVILAEAFKEFTKSP